MLLDIHGEGWPGCLIVGGLPARRRRWPRRRGPGTTWMRRRRPRGREIWPLGVRIRQRWPAGACRWQECGGGEAQGEREEASNREVRVGPSARHCRCRRRRGSGGSRCRRAQRCRGIRWWECGAARGRGVEEGSGLRQARDRRG
ncbi:hypothetical protein BS78_01G378400 [Paspalum vaginatum]|nr:hypothetical protein BS78_01G378400 [Paspalum vaginatum]